MISPAAIGIEIGPNRLRALRLGRRRSATEAMEVEWTEAAPDETVAALRGRFGTGARMAVAVDMSLLLVKRIALPAVPAEQRRQMVSLDPDRYFPVLDEQLVVGVRKDDLVVAASAEQFDRMTEALAALGAVERVEPAPAALVRHLTASGVGNALVIMADPHDEDCAVVVVRDGKVAVLRKLSSNASDIVAAALAEGDVAESRFLYPWREPLAEDLARGGLSVDPVPAQGIGAETFAAAHGALLGIDGPNDLTLTSPALARRRAVRGWRRGVLATAAVVVALAAAFWSVDLRRDRTLAELEHRIAERQAEAAEVQNLLAEIATAEEEVRTLAAVSRERQDPLEVLLLVTRLLPPDAHLRSLAATGDGWELDGYARDAASLIPTFEESDVLQDVRFRSATTRVQLADENYESFSLALRYVPAPQ